METTLSSRGQIVLPATARRRLHLSQGERLSVELREGGVFLRPLNSPRSYEVEKNPISGLPSMVQQKPQGRKVTAAQIAQLNAELL
jgi:AbrB family looped-hinge helix DNA binding protein